MIVLDIETTGLDGKKHSILSIGAVDFEHPTETFYGECRRWEGAEYQPKALEINGFTVEDIDNPEKQTEAELIASFMTWHAECSCKMIAGQNVFFDNGFLASAINRAGMDIRLSHRIYDLHTVCMSHIMQSGLPVPVDENGNPTLRSDDIARYVGLPTEQQPHNALNGALWEAEAFSRLLFGEKLLGKFDDCPLGDMLLWER